MPTKILYSEYEKPTDYLRFTDEQTKIHIVSSGAFVKKHSLRSASGFVPLGICDETAQCKHCLSGNEPKLKYTWVVYLPEKKYVKILETGNMIGDQICKIAKSKNIDPQEYEFTIIKKGSGLGTKYKVTLDQKKELTKEEVDFIAPTKRFLINKYLKNEKSQ